LTRVAIALTVGAFLFGGTTKAYAQTSVAVQCPGIAHGINFFRAATWKWQTKLGGRRTRSDFKAYRVHSCKYAVWVAHLWLRRSVHVRRTYAQMVREKKKREIRVLLSQGALTSDWACIHRFEGAWNSNTGNGYYGGLQMDVQFQSSYGSEFMARWGTADKWPVWAQVTAANRAKNSGRGYGPWPTTARFCGLL
jgi:hypothetical protein